jgi:hypothetical protein
MLEKIFERSWFLARHRQAPLLDEEFDSWRILAIWDSLDRISRRSLPNYSASSARWM